MTRFLSAILLMLGFATGSSYAQAPGGAATRAAVQANISASFPTNGAGLITAATMRSFLTQFTNSTFFWSSDYVPLSALMPAPANAIVGNATGTTNLVAAIALPSCSGASNALTWQSGAGFGCNTIAATTPANALVGNFSGAAPTSGIGADGMYAIDISNGSIYGPRASGVWPSTAVYTPSSGGGVPNPPAPTSISAVGGLSVSLTIVAPASPLFSAAYVYRVASGGGFAAATYLGSVSGTSGATLTYANSSAVGAWDYYAVSISAAGGMSGPTGPASGTVRAPVFAYATGDQSANITATSSSGLFAAGNAEWLVNGNMSGAAYFNTSALSSAVYLQFDFGTAKIVNEARWYQNSSSAPEGTWQWLASNDGATWTSIGSSFALGGASSSPQTLSTLNGNTTAWRYYRISGVSGSSSASPYVNQIQFQIGS